jgi:BirA family transcriptional regulator, biotin operon repressor / biotin---[acetyl-CoA-carboxylase] ligase
MVEAASWEAAARPGRRIGHVVEWHARIGSTNDRVRELLAGDAGEGAVVVADEQLAGRGRRGRTWSSPPGVNLMLSVGLRPRLRADQAWRLGLGAALAARTACLAEAPVDLKWPNDLVARDGGKVGGLLIETAVHGDRVAEAIIGIGINVNWRAAEMPAELRDRATSLADLRGAPVDRVALLGRLLDALDGELESLESGSGTLERYRDACRTIGGDVTVETGGEIVRGRAVDLDDAGSLVVETATGTRVVTSGEVTSVRPAVPA